LSDLLKSKAHKILYKITHFARKRNEKCCIVAIVAVAGAHSHLSEDQSPDSELARFGSPAAHVAGNHICKYDVEALMTYAVGSPIWIT
jgi:hypothetical protein